MCRGNYTSQLCVCILREQVRRYRKSALTPNLPQENSAGAQPGAKFELLATNITRNKLFLIFKKKQLRSGHFLGSGGDE